MGPPLESCVYLHNAPEWVDCGQEQQAYSAPVFGWLDYELSCHHPLPEQLRDEAAYLSACGIHITPQITL